MSLQEEEILGKAYDARLMRRLMAYLRPHKGYVGVALFALFGDAVLQLAQPYLVKLAIDRFIVNRDLAGLNRISILYLGLLFGAFAFEYVQTYMMQMLGQRIMYDMRMQIYKHLQRLDLSFYDKNPVGRLMTRVTTDVDVINDLFTSGVVAAFGDLLTLVGIMVTLLVMDWRLALLTFSVLPLIIAIAQWFRRNVRESYRHVRTWIARINAFLNEHINGMSTVQLFRREAVNFGRFEEINARHRDANVDQIFYYAVFYPAIELVAAGASALIIWYGGGLVIERTLTLGSLVAFLLYSGRFFRPISDMSEKFNTLQAAMASSERIFQLLDEEVVIESPRPGHGLSAPGSGLRALGQHAGTRDDGAGLEPRAQSLESGGASGSGLQALGQHAVTRDDGPGQKPEAGSREPASGPEPRAQSPEPASPSAKRAGHIVFDHVSFAYAAEPVLRDVSFEVRPGERVGIVGATGAGKSTLISLLLRFYDVTGGRITIDGVDIREMDLHELRRMFGLVLQDVHLFSGTIAGNIRLGSAITDEEVRAAAAAVHADEFIKALPGGFDAPVAERGATLSVGQKQLLSFARALAFNSPVLILDEATSSVDTETELLIRDALRVLMSGRTTLAIAHRLSTIQDMDKILVFHKGRLREAGNHQELLAMRGIYYKLFELQYRGGQTTGPTATEPARASEPTAQ